MFEWDLSQKFPHSIVSDNKELYVSGYGGINSYSFDGKLIINTFHKGTDAMEMINNQLYLLGDSDFCILDLKTNSIIERWNCPPEDFYPYCLTIDQETLYFTHKFGANANYVHLYTIKGKEIKKFGCKERSKQGGAFLCPAGITIDDKLLYVCDGGTNRIQAVNKEDGRFQHQWKEGQRSFNWPRGILLYQQLFLLVMNMEFKYLQKNINVFKYLEVIIGDQGMENLIG